MLKGIFDSVVMLTSSNWHTEPRSNRYHYATRFARELPVYFVQFDLHNESPRIEESGASGVTIIHVSGLLAPFMELQTDTSYLCSEALELFRQLGCRKPLVWIYNPYAVGFAKALNGITSVYHATENYFSMEKSFYIGTSNNKDQEFLVARAAELLSSVDLTIAVSDGVCASLQATGLAKGPVVPVYNGCDFEFWDGMGAADHVPPEEGRPVAFYQGGINKRLDFELLHALIHRLPDWDFWFCGATDESLMEWKLIRSHPNVHYFGNLPPDEIARLAQRAKVGVVPFKDNYVLRTSFPLKMYEYVACGLPVVSTPIRALDGEDRELFTFAETDVGFEIAIRALARTRVDPDALKRRRDAARANSYEKRFKDAERHISENSGSVHSIRKNVLILYDDKVSFVKTIEEHLRSFKSHSRNTIYFLPASIPSGIFNDSQYVSGDNGIGLPNEFNSIWNLDVFDAIVVHYSVRVSLDGYFSPTLVNKVRSFRGEKILFIQDEYEGVANARKYIDLLGITSIYTCVPPEGQDIVYPKALFPDLELVQTLTGYVPEDPGIEQHAIPMEERKVLIGYRGRRLPHHYGSLGYEKYIIGERVREEAQKRGLDVDVESDDSKRIYGSWYKFLGSSRATLGTESGANIFDWDGSMRALAEQLADRPFEDVFEEHFAPHEGQVLMNQISPKFFEAIRLRTALVCFPGTYSGILKKDCHYIPLEKDFSNIQEVFDKLDNVEFLKKLTERAYKDIIESGLYSYRSFVRSFDDWLDERVPYARAEVISAPIAVRRGRFIEPLYRDDRRDYVLSTAVLGGDWQREEFSQLFTEKARTVRENRPEFLPAPVATGADQADDDQQGFIAAHLAADGGAFGLAARTFSPGEAISNAQRPWYSRAIPLPMKRWAKAYAERVQVQRVSGRLSPAARGARIFWKVTPAPIRRRIARRLL